MRPDPALFDSSLFFVRPSRRRVAAHSELDRLGECEPGAAWQQLPLCSYRPAIQLVTSFRSSSLTPLIASAWFLSALRAARSLSPCFGNFCANSLNAGPTFLLLTAWQPRHPSSFAFASAILASCAWTPAAADTKAAPTIVAASLRFIRSSLKSSHLTAPPRADFDADQ